MTSQHILCRLANHRRVLGHGAEQHAWQVASRACLGIIQARHCHTGACLETPTSATSRHHRHPLISAAPGPSHPVYAHPSLVSAALVATQSMAVPTPVSHRGAWASPAHRAPHPPPHACAAFHPPREPSTRHYAAPKASLWYDPHEASVTGPSPRVSAANAASNGADTALSRKATTLRAALGNEAPTSSSSDPSNTPDQPAVPAANGAASEQPGTKRASSRSSDGSSSSSTCGAPLEAAASNGAPSSGAPSSGAPSSRGSSASLTDMSSSDKSESGGDHGSSSSGGRAWWEEAAEARQPPLILSPVVSRIVVIGWMGSHRRYLNKYGQLWARSGDHEVLMIRPTVFQTLVRWRGVVDAGKDIDRVARMHRENPAMPTFYHIFSTGGFIHAGTMWRWMDEVEDVAQRRDLLEEVKGIIFDSGPARVTSDIAARAIVSAVTRTPAELVEERQKGAVRTVRSVMDWYLRGKGVKLREEEVYDAWYNLAPVCPQLYLYSDADPLVAPAEIERYMAIQESRGVEVSSYRWADSGHCEHFRQHPHEYAYQISTFVAKALRDW